MFNREPRYIPLESLGLETIPGIDSSLDEAVKLRSGFSSAAYRVGEQVIKLSHSFFDPLTAEQHQQTLQSEHDLVSRYMGAYIPPTELHVVQAASSTEQAKVVTVQDYVEGHENIESFTAANIASGWQKSVASIREFLNQGLKMFDETSKAPDVANVQEGFRVFVNRNVVVTTEGEPFLVDTNFGRIQRSASLGPFWNRRIRGGMARLAMSPLLNTPTLAEAEARRASV